MSESPPAALLPGWRQALPSAAVLLAVALLWHGPLQSLPDARTLGLSLLLGLLFGALLQRSRFCFYCVSRDFLERRDARGLLGVLAALAVGTLGYHAVFGAFLPTPEATRLPPGAHIGPVSWVLVAGGVSFGLGMGLARSCISALWYRLGEGALAAPIALAGALLGFALGFLSWNTLYLQALQQAPTPWLPQQLGYGGSLALQLGVLALLALVLARLHRPPAQAPAAQAWWQRRWPTHVGGVLIGALATVAYLRVAPLGVTADLGSWARTGAAATGLLPARLEGLDVLRGCATAVKDSLWSNNGVFVLGLVAGAWASALLAGDFRPRWAAC